MGRNLETAVYHMDTKRKHNRPEQIEAQARIVLKKMGTWKPDVLVTLDDNAFRTVGLSLANTQIAIVFSGVNGQPEVYSRQVLFLNFREKPGHNVTGVYEKLHIADAIRVHSRMFPEMRELRIISDTSPTGQAISRQIRLELEGQALPCKWQM